MFDERNVDTSSSNPEISQSLQIYSDLDKKLVELPITYDTELSKGIVLEQEILDKYPRRNIVACDFAIKGIIEGEETQSGFRKGPILSIDHHAGQSMERIVSSTNLAINQVNSHGLVNQDDLVLINHCDADSILASSIVRGILPPEERFGQAAIAADHTGEVNGIADLLQALQSKKDPEFSLRNLSLLLTGRPIEMLAQQELTKRLNEREECRRLVESGKIQFLNDGRLAYAVLDHELSDSVFFPALLPDSTLILVFMPFGKDIQGQDIWRVRVRSGLNIFPGFSIHKLGLNQVDSNYGGRWNGGSNTRLNPDNDPPRGTKQLPQDYILKVSQKLDEYINNSSK